MEFAEATLKLISQISAFMRFFVPGYIFISCFNFTACLEKEEKIEYLLVKSIAFSYIISTVLDAINKIDLTKCVFKFKPLNGIIEWIQINGIMFLLISAIILGFLIGKASGWNWIQRIVSCLFRRDTTDNVFTYIWRNIGKGKIVCAKFSLKAHPDYIYEGQIEKICTVYKNPIIVFRYYKCDKINVDLSNVDQGRIIVPYSDIDIFEILINE